MDPDIGSSSGLFGTTLPRRKLLQLSGGAFAGAVLLGACGDDDSSSGSDDSGGPPDKPDKIIVRAWGDPYSTTLGAFPGASFTEKTGIDVEFDLTDFPEMKAKVEQAVAADQRPFIDVAYTTTPDAFIASSQEYAATMDRSLLTNYDNLTAVGRAGDGTLNYVNIYTYTLPILYRTDLVTFPEEMSLDELWDPKYEGLVSLNLDPNLLVWPMAKKLGLDPETDDLTPLWDRLAELKPNIGAIFTSDTEFLELINGGEVAIGFGLPGNAGFIDNGATKVPTEGVSLSSDALYVPAGLPDNVTYWATVFVNEVIEATNQTEFNQAIATVPTNSMSTPLESMQGDPAFPFTDEELAKYAVPVRDDVFAANRDDWIERMTVALQG